MPSTLFSLLKDSISRDAVARTAEEHEGRFDPGGDEDPRESGCHDLATDNYKLFTDFYEQGWGESLHFAPRHANETFEASLIRHQRSVGDEQRLGAL